jgi:choline kinase
MNTKVVVLAAGNSSRLNRDYPKCLVRLSNGKTILEQILSAVSDHIDLDHVLIVVGSQKELIIEAFPNLLYAFNKDFNVKENSKSLLLALRKLENHDVICINSDVVLESEVVQRVFNFPNSCMAVSNSAVGDEEIKYNVNKDGCITEVSKTAQNALGEAVGVSKFAAKDLPLLREKLLECKDTDYFERGIELAINQGLQIYPVDISDLICMEVDFEEDLKLANATLRQD